MKSAVKILPSADVNKNLFVCNDEELIQVVYVCDGRLDCSDGSDEYNCCMYNSGVHIYVSLTLSCVEEKL